MATLISHTGTLTQVEPNNTEDFSLCELQKYVDGYIEIIRLYNDFILVVNEEGIPLGLPINTYASIVAQQPIFGNAVLCKDNEVK